MNEKPTLFSKITSLFAQYHFSGAFLLIGVVVVGMAAFLVLDIRTAMSEAELIYARSVRGLDLIGELQFQTQEARRSMTYALTTEDNDFQLSYVEQSRDADAQVARIMEEHRVLVSTPREIQASQTFERDWANYLSIRDEVINHVLAGNTDQGVQLDLAVGMGNFNAVSDDLHLIKTLYDDQAKSRLSDLAYTFNMSLLKVGIILILTLILAASAVKVFERGKRLQIIQQSEARLNAVIESINDAMFVVGHDGRVELVNHTAEEKWDQNQSEMLGRYLSDILPDLKQTALPATITESVRTGNAATVQAIRLSGEQSDEVYEARVFPFEDGTTVFFNDVTERQQAEDERLRLSKLESIGLLAGGIAHDFNNIMTGVLGYISFAKLDLKQDDPIYDRLAEAEQAAIEAKNLTQQLLTFAKGGAPVKQMTSIADLLVESATFVLRGSNVRCEWEIPDDLWPVDVDTGQINQVIHNLVINAIQASPDGGILTIRGDNMILGSSTEIRGGSSLAPGFYVKLSFSDQGLGMTQEQLENIFDPYFTTKATGTGLGLTTVFTIISRHDGAITVDSTPGEGTTFEVYLPASSHPHSKEEGTEILEVQQTLEEGHGKILIMVDEAVIRELAAKSLSQYGYEVQIAEEGEGAIKLYKEAMDESRPFDIVIMDLTIPGGMGGEEAIAQIKEMDPDVKAIVSSGYHNAAIMANYKEHGFCEVVAKPYRVQDLFEAIQDIMK
ncbi:MAG: response regulator [Candidatus Latescibacteria bacterium]|nr:response regulator [Candidatus Latescibacterota bacterium]